MFHMAPILLIFSVLATQSILDIISKRREKVKDEIH